jgi:NAD-dependent deacetylase
MKNIVVLTGAGISAESGIQTFRASDGLWENHRLEDVASPLGWKKDPALVLEFYNQRRKKAQEVQPNAAHFALAQLEGKFSVQIITQNVDDLHERAGSSQVLHLHGELNSVRSSADENVVFHISEVSKNGWELELGQLCPLGSQLRPDIVWFGEMVPKFEQAKIMAQNADFFLVVGTSLVVYPAAGLLEYVPSNVSKCIIDPNLPKLPALHNLYTIEEPASSGVPRLVQNLLG